MTQLNFPTTGLYDGYQYTGDNGVVYIYDGVKWVGHAPNSTPGNNSIVNDGHVVQVDGSGNLIIPDGTTIKYQNGDPVVTGGSTATSSLVNGGYSVLLNTDGNLIVPPSSAIYPSTGTITISTYDGNTRAWADDSGFYVDTLYHSEEYEWHFGNSGGLLFPNGAGFALGDSGQLKVDDVNTVSIDLRDSSGRGPFTNSDGFTIRSNGDTNWLFGADGNLTVPSIITLAQGGATIAPDGDNSIIISGQDGASLYSYITTATTGTFGYGLVTSNYQNQGVGIITAQVGSDFKNWIFGTDGDLTVAGNIKSATIPQVGTIITGIEAYLGGGAPYNYVWNNNGTPNFYSLYDLGSSIIGWTFYTTTNPGDAVTIIALDTVGAGSLGFSGDPGAGPYTAQSPDYAPAYANNLQIATGSSSWTFSTDGNLYLPATPGATHSGQIFAGSMNGFINLDVEFDNDVYGGVRLGTQNETPVDIVTNFGIDGNTWRFDSTGTLILPEAGQIQNLASAGLQIITGQGTLDIGNADEPTLNSHFHIRLAGDANTVTNLFLGDDSQFVRLANDGALALQARIDSSSPTIISGAPGIANTGGDVVIQGGAIICGGCSGAVPGNAYICGTNVYVTGGAGNYCGPYQPTVTVGGGNVLSETCASHAWLYGSGEWSIGSRTLGTQIFSTGTNFYDIEIHTNQDNNIWAFGGDGTLRFPNNTVQNTAFTGGAQLGYALTVGNANDSGTYYETAFVETTGSSVYYLGASIYTDTPFFAPIITKVDADGSILWSNELYIEGVAIAGGEIFGTLGILAQGGDGLLYSITLDPTTGNVIYEYTIAPPEGSSVTVSDLTYYISTSFPITVAVGTVSTGTGTVQNASLLVSSSEGNALQSYGVDGGNSGYIGAAFDTNLEDFAVYAVGYTQTSSYVTSLLTKVGITGSVWHKSIDLDQTHMVATSVAVDSTGSVYVTSNEQLNQNNGFLTKLNSSGEIQWQVGMGFNFTGDEMSVYDGCVVVDGNGDIITAWNYGAIDSQYADILIVKFNSDGNCLWQRSIGTAEFDQHLFSTSTFGASQFLTADASSFYIAIDTGSTPYQGPASGGAIKLPLDGTGLGTWGPWKYESKNWTILPNTASGGSLDITGYFTMTGSTLANGSSVETGYSLEPIYHDLTVIQGAGGLAFTRSRIQEGSVSGTGNHAVTSITGLPGTGVGLTSDDFAQLMWVPSTADVSLEEIDNGGPNIYNWAYSDGNGFTVENRTSTSTSQKWFFDIHGGVTFPDGTTQTTAWSTSTAVWPSQIVGGGGNGYTGSAGAPGGCTGYTGSQGDIGYQGSVGYQGAVGYQGSAGAPGGGCGYTGSQGCIGFTGSAGTNGNNGNDGATGYIGSQGIQGIIGYTGSAGSGGGGGIPSGYGSVGYSQVIQISTRSTGSWTAYRLTGDMIATFSGQQATTSTSSQLVYGNQYASGDKVLIINDAPILSTSTYGLLVEFPASPGVGDTFAVPAISLTTATTINVGSMSPGVTYTIVSLGNTVWSNFGVSGMVGQSFQYNGGYNPGGTGTVSYQTPSGVNKLIFKPAAGQQAVLFSSNGYSQVLNYVGTGTGYIAAYTDLSLGVGNQPITWVYAGVINGIPTWYQMYF